MNKSEIEAEIERLKQEWDLLLYKPAHMHIKPRQERIALKIRQLKDQLENVS